MIQTKKPEVFLWNYTPMPLHEIGLAVSAWSSDNFHEYIEDMSHEEALKLTNKGLKAFHKVSLEYVNFTFVIKNVSRAFQQQLTRTRLASYSIQSMRVVDKKGFAEGGHYTMPPNLNEDQQAAFDNSMLKIQYMYNHLLKINVPTEDARGILPLNIHSDISMHISLSALQHMLKQRFCVLTQWEFRQVAVQMREHVKRIHPLLAQAMEAPCVHINKCPMREEYCGIPIWKLSDEERTEQYTNWSRKNAKS